MAVTATLQPSQGSSVGFWAEATMTASLAVTGTTTTSMTILAFAVASNPGATATASYVQFNPNLPVACTVLAPGTLTASSGSTYTTIQGGANNLATQQSTNTGGIGLVSCIYGVTNNAGTLTLTFVNAGASSTLSVGTRLLFVQNQGN